MKIKELLETNPNDLAEKQETALREYAIEKLKKIADLLKWRKYDEVAEMLEVSPAGDGMGYENSYIDFSETGLDDIGQVVEKLKELHKLAERTGG